jgi:hypothetical protein
MEEVERTHQETLRIVLDDVNMRYGEHVAQEQRRVAREAENDERIRREHEQHVRDVASRLKFD